MRSTLVSSANHQVRNRFLLCQMTSEATRSLHRTSTSVHQTINDVLVLIADGKLERPAGNAPTPDLDSESEPGTLAETASAL
jgi:hypothetical protein